MSVHGRALAGRSSMMTPLRILQSSLLLQDTMRVTNMGLNVQKVL